MALSFLNQELAIDLGTANTVIYQNGQIVLDEPSIVAIDNNTGKCLAIGQKAKLMHERINPGIKTEILGDTPEVVGRYADSLEPIFEKTKAELGDTAKCDEDVLSYIAFPQVAEKFFEKRKAKEENVAQYTIVEVEEEE